jgi:glycosyltransferase involved in cell wall biosynthesis
VTTTVSPNPGRPKRAASVVLLTYDEVQGTRALLPMLAALDAEEVFAMDGGSRDGTVELLEQAGIRVVPQVRPGRGPALIEACALARNEYVVVFSPDGNEDPADISKLLDLLDAGADLAIASRFLPGSRNEEDDVAFPFRAWANRAFGAAVNLLWNRGRFVTDTINGFRAFRRSRIAELHLDAPGMTIEYQMTSRALKKGLDIREIPTREGDRIGGATHAPAIRTGIAFLKVLAREVYLGRRPLAQAAR